MAFYEVSTTTSPDSTVVIPSQIVFPDVRYAAPSGTLAKGDTIEGMITLRDSSGNIKPLEFEGFLVAINDWPVNPNQEILAVLSLNFAISSMVPSPPPLNE